MHCCFCYVRLLLLFRLVELFLCSRQEMKYAKGKRRTGGGSFLWMRGLPFSCTEKDIVDFFSGYGIEEGNCAIQYRTVGKLAGKRSGGAVVRFPSRGAAQEARQELNNQTMQRRYIELFPASARE